MSEFNFIDKIADLNPEARKADGFDSCIIGIASLSGGSMVLAYNTEKCICLIAKRDRISRQDAEEFFEFNVAGACVGEGTPIFIDTQL